MTDHLILLAPSANRVYAGQTMAMSAAELAVLVGARPHPVPISGISVAGVDYLRLDVETLDDELEAAIGRLSAFFALFRREHGRLTPVPVLRSDLFDDDLVTIPKYPGKTNEQFSRLLLNVTLASASRPPSAGASVLDPMCGRGTTLSLGLTFGHDVAGVDADLKAVEAYAAYLRTYLRRARLKHTAAMSPVRRDGRNIGRRLDVEVTPQGAERALTLTVFSGDTRQSAALYGKRRFDAVVTDAPYGIVHGSRTAGGRDRSPAGLIADALPVWSSQLKTGGALGLSWNTFGLTRERLVELAVAGGLAPLDHGQYVKFAHRVDSSIARDILVAIKK